MIKLLWISRFTSTESTVYQIDKLVKKRCISTGENLYKYWSQNDMDPCSQYVQWILTELSTQKNVKVWFFSENTSVKQGFFKKIGFAEVFHVCFCPLERTSSEIRLMILRWRTWFTSDFQVVDFEFHEKKKNDSEISRLGLKIGRTGFVMHFFACKS